MNARMRNRYLADSVTTASPATLLVQLYDRLVLDLTGAEQAAVDGDRQRVNDLLSHAQDIVAELHATLRMDVWDGAAGLAQIYEFSLRSLVQATITCEAHQIADIRSLFEPLRDAWREAAAQLDGQPVAASMTA